MVDASVAVKWVIEEPGAAKARRLAGARLEAPDLLLVECARVFWEKVRLGELAAEQAVSRMLALSKAPLSIVPSADVVELALGLALELDLDVYDCIYLALAGRLRLPLVTADRGLVSAVQPIPELAAHVILLDELAV